MKKQCKMQLRNVSILLSHYPNFSKEILALFGLYSFHNLSRIPYSEIDRTLSFSVLPINKLALCQIKFGALTLIFNDWPL